MQQNPQTEPRTAPARERVTARQVQDEYSRGNSYKQRLGLYEQVKKNERFYLGDQWNGLRVKSVRPVVMNFLRRATTYFQAMIVSDDIGVQLRPFLPDEQGELTGRVYEKAIERVMERCKIRSLNRESLRDACVDGDSMVYYYFDPDEPSGQPQAEGDIRAELLMNTNVIFGNPASSEVQSQPYIIIVRRRPVEDVRREAEAMGAQNAKQITGESDNDIVNSELDDGENLCNELVRFWKAKGEGGRKHVFMMRCVGNIVLEQPKDTGLRLYPMAWWSWEKRKNCFHGVSPITEVIPTQIAVNQLWTAVNMYVQNAGFPKVIYSRNKFPHGYDGNPGKAIAVEGDVRDAQTVVTGGVTLPPTILNVIDGLISKAMEMMGVSDAALGNVRPDNQSAIIAVQQATAAPLNLQRLGFYQFVEDQVRVIVDLMRAYYGVRAMMIQQETTDPMTGEVSEQDVVAQIDFGQLEPDSTELQVDIGQAAYWSQLDQIQSADNLFQKGLYAEMADYLDSVPEGYVKNQKELVRKLREKTKRDAALAAQQPPTAAGQALAMPQM